VDVLTSVDDAVARWCAAHRTDALDHVVLWLASRDVYLGFIVLAALVAIALSMWFGGWIPIARVALVLSAVSFLTGWIKPVIDRPRPPADLALMPMIGPSMPSSHALMTAAMVVAVAMADWWASARLRRAALAVGVAGCVVIGSAMVYLGGHWLTDVLVGWAIGIGLTATLMRLTAAPFAGREPSPDEA
jgi:membrane-associated phospholipid phosphatase